MNKVQNGKTRKQDHWKSSLAVLYPIDVFRNMKFYVSISDGRIRFPRERLLSKRVVRCLTNVEAFVLRSMDIEEVMSLYAKLLGIDNVQRDIRRVPVPNIGTVMT